jgi:hypothetical protein
MKIPLPRNRELVFHRGVLRQPIDAVRRLVKLPPLPAGNGVPWPVHIRRTATPVRTRNASVPPRPQELPELGMEFDPQGGMVQMSRTRRHSSTTGRDDRAAQGSAAAPSALRRARSFLVNEPAEDSGPSRMSFAALVGDARAREMDNRFGELAAPRIKHGQPWVHEWERTLHPLRVVIPVGNPKGVDLKEFLDLDALKAGTTPMMWMMSMGSLVVAPEIALGERDPVSQKEKRLGHPSLVGGERLGRIAGELHWDAAKQVFYITAKSGRYCKGRAQPFGLRQLQEVAKEFAACGLAVKVRALDDGGPSVRPTAVVSFSGTDRHARDER